MDRYNTLVSRHLIAAVIEVGQAKGGVTLDTDAMVGWLTSLPAKELLKVARTLHGLADCVERANEAAAEREMTAAALEDDGKANMRMLGREAGQVHDTIVNRFGRVIQCPMCEGYTSPEKQQCECCDREIAPF